MFTSILLSEGVQRKQVQGAAALSAASYPASGSYIPVNGMTKFAFIFAVGALDSALTCQVQQAVGVSGTPKNITGAAVTIPADGDNKYYMVEVDVDQLDINNDYNCVSVAVSGAAGSNDYAAILFEAWPADLPPADDSTLGALVSLNASA